MLPLEVCASYLSTYPTQHYSDPTALPYAHRTSRWYPHPSTLFFTLHNNWSSHQFLRILNLTRPSLEKTFKRFDCVTFLWSLFSFLVKILVFMPIEYLGASWVYKWELNSTFRFLVPVRPWCGIPSDQLGCRRHLRLNETTRQHDVGRPKNNVTAK